MEWLIKHRSELEVINFIAAGPLLLLVSLFGLRQLGIGLKQLSISAQQLQLSASQLEQSRVIASEQARRDACKLAAEQCRAYRDTIIPAEGRLNAVFAAGEMPAFQKVKVTELQNGKFEADFSGAKDWGNEYRKHGREITDLANSLEAFAVWFTCGAADERIAFRPISLTYCNTVRQLLPYFVRLNSEQGLFEHTLQLYVTWRDRRQELELKTRKLEIEQKLQALSTKEIKPIGI